MSNARILTYLGLAYVVTAWAFNTVVVKHAISDINPLAFTALRFCAMAPLTVLLALVRKEPLHFRKRDIPLLIGCGLCGYGMYQYFWILGLSNTTPFASALLGSLTPIFTLAIAAGLGHERVHTGRWAGALIALAGVAIFEGALSGNFAIRLGDGLTLCAAATFATYNILSSRLLNRYSPLSLLAITMVIGTIAFLPGALPSLVRQDFHHLPAVDWWIYGYAIVFPIVLTFPVWSYGITQLGVARVSLFAFAVPILTGIFSVLLLHVPIAHYQVVGGLVCIGGMAAAQLFGKFSLTALWAQRTQPMER
ncbi:MAG: DMT family transporter [Candidatus Eremiobacteraeota bacterium]|nr:DMT family transporter [Candidatus Eremiobacteraeota bacterium]